MNQLKVKRLKEGAKLPKYGSEGAAGLDLFSNQNCQLEPGERAAIKTDISMEIPEHHVGLIWDRSGHALKRGLHTLAGVIDSDYRGNIAVIVLNTSNEPIVIEKGQKIAQMLIQSYTRFEIADSQELDTTIRGDGGFGSTGD